jgi:hypothetical protein
MMRACKGGKIKYPFFKKCAACDVKIGCDAVSKSEAIASDVTIRSGVIIKVLK